MYVERKDLIIRGKMFKILIFTFLISNFLWGNSIKDNLVKIPSDHQQELRLLFYRIFFTDDGVYTLCGDKPVSLSGDFIITPWENTLEGVRCSGTFWKWWDIWGKYKDLFPSTKYLIIREPHTLNKQKNIDLKNDLIVLINKESFKNCINEHLSLFEALLNKKIDPKIFLEGLENNHLSFLESINHNEMILGILLGYGKNNASLFVKRNRNSFEFCQDNDFYVGDAKLKPIHKKLNFFGDYRYSPLIVGSIHFMADFSDQETKALRKKYQELRGKISAIYAQGDLLEITLTKLISVD